MSSVCTLRLKRRRAFSRGSPSCTRTSAKKNTPPNGPNWDIYTRIRYLARYLHDLRDFSCNVSPGKRQARPVKWLDRRITMPREIGWTDFEEIGIQLQEKFPEIDP